MSNQEHQQKKMQSIEEDMAGQGKEGDPSAFRTHPSSQ